jgi:uncharacterized membrane protein YeaQ/YmgE (transglycosylase-associated protein family)
MSVFSWLMIGALTGWLGDTLAGMDGRRGLLLSVVVGIVAAILGGWLYGGLLGDWAINPARPSVGGLLVSFLTATGLLIVARLARITG